MATFNYLLNFNDITKTGLSLSFTVFNKVGDNSSVISPGITELGSGFYKFSIDAASIGDDIYYVATDGGSNVLTGLASLNSLNSLNDAIIRVLGLEKENQFIDTAIYDINNNLTSARLRTYSLAGSVGTDNDVLATYTITSTYTGSNMDTFSVVKV